MSRFPSLRPSTKEQRRRLLRGLVLVHVGQPQPMTGTPMEVPVPKKTIWPRKSEVTTTLFKIDRWRTNIG
jgi:hypothetical protein